MWNSAGPRWGAVIGQECFHADIWAFLGLGFLTLLLSVFLGRVWRCLLSELFFKCRGRSEGFSVYVCNEGQSHEKECVNYYSLNSRLKEERLTWWKPVDILWGMWRSGCSRGGFSREEIKQNIQYDLICEHNFEACLWGYWDSLVTLSGRLHSQPWQLKIHTGLVWRQYHFP